MKPFVIIASCAALAAAALATTPVRPALAATETGASASCFLSREWTGTKAVDEHKMYIRVNNSQVYEVEFKTGCSRMDEPWAKFITISRGAGAICSPIDLDIKVSTVPGVTTACIASGLRKLSDQEVAALPKDQQP